MRNKKLWMRFMAAVMSAALVLPTSAIPAWGGVNAG